MASKDAIAKETTIAIRRLTESGQALGDHLGLELSKLPIHPRFGQDYLRAKQLSTLAGWLEQIGQAVLSQPESTPEPEEIPASAKRTKAKGQADAE